MSVQPVKHNLIIGLTGGIASGKTTASTYLKSLDIPVIDSDQIVKTLWKTDQKMIQQAESLFGFPIKDQNDLKHISKLIFSHEELRNQLNQIVHPRVFEVIEVEKKNHQHDGIIIIDMPLLFEVGYQDKVDYVCVVYVSKSTQIKRLMARDMLTQSEAEHRLQSQLDIEKKKALAHVVFNNEKEPKDLYVQIDDFLRGIGYEK